MFSPDCPRKEKQTVVIDLFPSDLLAVFCCDSVAPSSPMGRKGSPPFLVLHHSLHSCC